MWVVPAPLSNTETGDLTDGEMKCYKLGLGLEVYDIARTANSVSDKELVNGCGIEESMTQGLAKNVVDTLELCPETLPERLWTM